MRILQVNFCRAVGGSSFHHADLARGLAERGHAVLVVDRLGDFTPRYAGGGVGHVATRRGLLHVSLLRAIRSFSPDLIHAHQSLGSRIANRLKGAVPVVSTIHGAYNRRSYGRSDGIIRVADHQRDAMAGYEGPSVTLWNWLRGLGEAATARPAERADFGIAEDAVVFGAIGRVLAAKGVLDLVAAFRTLSGADARLLIAGEGKDMAAARALADGDGRIVFTGHRDDVPSLMRMIDVFVMASHAEAFPLALIEAAAGGCAIIATETKGARELLSGQPATFVPVQDRAALAGAMESLLAKARGVWERPAYDLSGFDRDGQIDKTVAFYRSLPSLRREG